MVRASEELHDEDGEETGVTQPARSPTDSLDEELATSAMTVLDKPVSTGRGRRVLGTDVATPRDAMRLEELQSTRVFLLAGVALGAAVFAALPFLDADPIAKWVLVAGIGLAGIVLGWGGLAIRKPDGYKTHHALALAIGSSIAGWTAIYYFGILSAASLATVMGIFFFALTHRLPAAVAGYTGAALGPIGLWVFITAGVVEDRGMIRVDDLTAINQVTLLGLIQFVFFITFVIARGSRRSRVEATAELDLAVRQVAQREALLDEAKRELDQALRVGGPGRFTDQVLGSFRLGVLAGRGAMGEVYEAVHTQTKQLAAVKLLSRNVLSDEEQVRRFIRETNIMRDMDTPHVVRVLEVGDDRAPLPYLAMELLRGEDLAQMLRRRRRLPVEECVRMLDEVSKGVAVAHEAGVVHRDLKPQNLFLQSEEAGHGVWKVLDFGVSRLLSSDGTLTRGQAIGTPSYMAPEQARGRDSDHRADVFALSVVAYRSLTGRPAFSGKEIPTILHNVVYMVPPRPSDLPDIPEAFDHVFAIGLAKRRADRFDSVLELATTMRAAALDELPPDVRERGERLAKRFQWGTKLK